MSKALLGVVAGTPTVLLAGLFVWVTGHTEPAPGLEQTVYAAPAPQQVARRSRESAPAVTGTAATGTAAAGAAALPQVSEQWVAQNAAKAGIPVPAMRAYARAQLMAPCAIGWTTLAGLGWVESQNGTLGGRTLGDDGVPSRRIVGPALSGGLDHAYGPMQFIPVTWRTWASDGDGDGRANINDIDDAAYAAARYLCASGQDLGSGAGWAAAIFSYNHSQQYVDDVYAAATAYDARTR